MTCRFEYICCVLSCGIPHYNSGFKTSMFLTPIVCCYCYIICCNVSCNVESHGEKTDVLKLTCHYCILAIYLVQSVMMDEVINPKHVAYTSIRKYVLCITERLARFPRFSYTQRDVFCQNSNAVFYIGDTWLLY